MAGASEVTAPNVAVFGSITCDVLVQCDALPKVRACRRWNTKVVPFSRPLSCPPCGLLGAGARACEARRLSPNSIV